MICTYMMKSIAILFERIILNFNNQLKFVDRHLIYFNYAIDYVKKNGVKKKTRPLSNMQINNGEKKINFAVNNRHYHPDDDNN